MPIPNDVYEIIYSRDDFTFPRWSDSLRAKQCFRIYGLYEILAAAELRDVTFDKKLGTEAQDAVPEAWKGEFQQANTWEQFGKPQVGRAKNGDCQIFDKACTSVVYFYLLLISKGVDTTHYFERIRIMPCIYRIFGFQAPRTRGEPGILRASYGARIHQELQIDPFALDGFEDGSTLMSRYNCERILEIVSTANGPNGLYSHNVDKGTFHAYANEPFAQNVIDYEQAYHPRGQQAQP